MRTDTRGIKILAGVLLFWILGLTVWALTAPPAFQAPPVLKTPAPRLQAVFKDEAEVFKPVLVGPETASPGDLIVLDATMSVGVSAFKWTPAGHSGGFLEVDNGARIVMAYGKPGRYTFVLAVAGSVEGQLFLDQLVHTVVVGKPAPPRPDPKPEPPVPPSKFGLREFIKKIALEVQDPEGAAILANNYDAVSSAISAGAYKIVDDAFAAVAERNRDGLSDEQKTTWSDFSVKVPGKFKELFEANKVHTLPQLAEAFLEVAKGLR